MTRRPLLAIAAAAASMLLLAGCQTPVVTMVTPPGWGNEGGQTAEASTAPTIDQVRFAEVPDVCGVPGGALVDGSLSVPPNSTPILGGPTDSIASDVHIAADPKTKAPLIALAANNEGAIGAAAVFECVIDDEVSRDRVVVWDSELTPVGVINLAALRGAGPVAGLSIAIDPVTARVTFQEVAGGTAAAPAGQRMTVPLTVENGHLVVGAITVG